MAPSDIEASLDGDSKLENVEEIENAGRVDPELERR